MRGLLVYKGSPPVKMERSSWAQPGTLSFLVTGSAYKSPQACFLLRHNMNTGKPRGEDAEGVVAEQTLFHSAEYPW